MLRIARRWDRGMCPPSSPQAQVISSTGVIPLPTPRMYTAAAYEGGIYTPGHGEDARWLRWCRIEARARALYGELLHVRLRHHEVGELQEVQQGLQHHRRGRRRAALAVPDGRGARRACRGSAVCSFHVPRGRVPIGGAVRNLHSVALPERRPEQQHGRGAPGPSAPCSRRSQTMTAWTSSAKF